MSKTTKKARSSAATPERTETGAGARQTATSVADFITAGAGRQMRIAEMLGRGQENAVPLQHLVTMTGLDSRTIRQQIERERRAGIPICSDNLTGYFLPISELERDRCVRSMRHRAREIQMTAEAIAIGRLFKE